MKDKMERDLAYLATEDTRLAAEGRAEPERAATAGAENDGVFSFVADMNEIIFITDTDRGVIVASDLAREVFGISGAAAGRHIEDYLPKVYMDAISQRTKDEDARRMKLTFPVKDASGREVMLETRFNWFWLDGRRLLSITCRDINDIMNAMSDLTEREDRYRTIFRESPIGFVHVNSDGYITDCNNSFTAIFGLDKSDVVGVCLAEENSLDVYAKFKKAAMDAVVGFSSRHESQFSMRDDRGHGWVRVAFSPVISENHAFLGAIGIVEDITEAKNAADRINFVSSHDALTGLMNRRMCEEAIKNFENQGYAPLGVIYADLNCLKLANDAFGHAEGDRLLKTAARILADNAGRSGDAYRLGGDEFLLLIRDASAAAIDERVRNIAKTCVGWKVEGFVAPSMALGGAVKVAAEQCLDDVIKEAEDTMYANKMKNGKPTRMRILGLLESRLYTMRGSAVGDRSKRIISWGEWFISGVDYACDRDILRLLCRYHDVGLLACPEEIQIIGGDCGRAKVASPMQHMAVGYRIAKCTAEIAGVAEYILSHHEWWDGMGYPNQQRGSEIPPESRIISIFDSLEGMFCLRGEYRMKPGEILESLEASAGRQFDPDLIGLILPAIKDNPPNFFKNMES